MTRLPIIRNLRTLSITLCGAVFILSVLSAASNTLDIYFIDTEGGQCTLLLSPSGETFMIDTGFAGLDTNNPDKDVARDAHRIQEVAKAAGVERIDALLASHFHGDHMSGVTHLTEVLPVRRFLDHGPATQDTPTMKQKAGEYSEYWAAAFAKAQHQVVKAGDKIQVKGLDILVVEALGQAIDRAGEANPHCAGLETRQDGNPEDTASVGVVVQYGKFRFSNFGDLPWNQELALLCPGNRVGRIDVYQTPGHGREPSSAVYAMSPRIAVLDNGPRKGGGPASLKAFRASPGFEDYWEVHKNLQGAADANPGDEFAANLEDSTDTMHPAHYLKVSARDDGSFSVLNSRTGQSKTYPARKN